MKNSFLLFVFLSCSLFVENYAIKCYSCTKTANSGDDACVDDVESLGKAAIMSCTKKFCTIFRQELLDPAGKVNSFSRTCEDEPVFLDHIEEDSQFKTYYRSCTEELCNNWDAVNYGTDVNNPDRTGGANFVAKGMDNGVSRRKEASVIALMMGFLLHVVVRKWNQ